MPTSPGVLDARWGRSGAIRFEERFGGSVALLTTVHGTAVVALQGAQVLSFVPAGGDEVLWLSPVAKLGTGKAVRGGVPVCWPWFGPNADDPKKPAHGFVRAAMWDVTGTEVTRDGASIRLQFDATKIDPTLWSRAAVATIQVTLSHCLEISLTTENSGSAPLSVTQALHTYLAVSDVSEITIDGLAGRPYIDQLAPGTRPIQRGIIKISGEFDRIYQQTPDTVIVHDSHLKRRLRVTKTGSASTVVWNPGSEKAARLGDMGTDGYRGMVCIETANAGDDVVTLAPGGRHLLTTRIAVETA